MRRAAAIAGLAVVLLTSVSGTAAADAGTGSIAGRVTDDGGAPLAGICVWASAATTSSSTPTASDGRYQIDGLAPATYRVQFRDCVWARYAAETYDDVHSEFGATPVSVQAGSTTSGIDAALTAAGTIRGRLSDTDGNPIDLDPNDSCRVTAYLMTSFNGAQIGIGYGATHATDGPGSYVVKGLPPGDYRVVFSGCHSYFPETWMDLPFHSPSNGTPIPLAVDEDVRGIDMGISIVPRVYVGRPNGWEASEGTRSLAVPVRLSRSTDRAFTITYATHDYSTGGLAQAGVDYQSVSGRLTMPAGSTAANLHIPIVSDTVIEGEERFYIEFVDVLHPSVVVQYPLTIRDDDPAPPGVSIRVSSVGMSEMNENRLHVPISVTLSSAASQEVSVQFGLVAGSATPGTDFEPKSGKIVFPPGTLQRNVRVTILPDRIAEPNEDFSFHVFDPTGAAIAVPSGQIVIENDDI